MNLIYDIVRKLNKQEIRQIRHRIKHASFEYEKLGKLFELVTRYEEKEEAFYAQKLYGKEPDNTFRVTKSRLKRMLENVLLNDKSLNSYSSAAINARLQTRKKLLQGEILLGRGAYQASKNLLQQVISTAKKYDLTDVLFQAELLLYRHNTILTSVKEHEKRTQALINSNDTITQINEATILHYHISNLLLHKTPKPEELAQIRKHIDRMAAIAEETDHPLIRSMYYLTENYFFQIKGDFQQALDFAYKYLDILQKEASIHSPSKVISAYVQLAKISIQLGNNVEARQFCKLVFEGYPEDGMNYLVGLELTFRLAFYTQEYQEALSYIQSAFANKNMEASKLLAAKWHYFHACVLFQIGDFNQAYHKLNETTPLLSDKYGMNISIRVLEIMILFELGHIDLLETKILNMRQFIKRTQQKKELFRPSMLIKILMEWYKQDYRFDESLSSASDKLKALAEYHKETPFRTTDFELVRLEKWMEQKVQSAR